MYLMISPLGTAGGLQLTSMTVMLIILTKISLGGEGAGEWRDSEWISAENYDYITSHTWW